jgi:hypothetical protein
MVESLFKNFLVHLSVYLLWSGTFLYSQDFRNDLKSKLKSWDQKILYNAEEYKAKAAAIRNYDASGALPGIPGSTSVDPETYYEGILEGANYVIFATEYESEVLHRNVLLYRNSYTGNPAVQDSLIILQNAAYDSLYLADEIREKVQKRLSRETQASMILQAERIEESALFSLSKVLFTYIHLPEEPVFAWLHSKDTLPPYISTDQPGPVQDEPAMSSAENNSSIYSKLNVEEKDVDGFNNFLEKKNPELLESILVEKKMPGNDQMNEIKEEWTAYNKAGKMEEQPKEPINLNKQSEKASFVYKVQIVACREKLSPAYLKRVYHGPEPITESFEENWFKYTIGGYSTYREAKQLKYRSQVKKAFVVSYLNGKRFRITMAMVKAVK